MRRTTFRATPTLGVLTLVLALVLALAWSHSPATAASPRVLTVSAAASLGDVIAAVKSAFEADLPGVRIELNLGSSGALRRQIELGAPVDVFLSAAEEPIRAMVDRGLISGDEVHFFAANRLVLVRSAYAPTDLKAWEDLLREDVGRVAVGNPEHVPAGQYAREVLEQLGLWERLQGKIVFGEDARQVLAYVESGAADAAVVYATDAAAARRVFPVAEPPDGSHAPILYPAAVVLGSGLSHEARTFIRFLLSARGQEILVSFGFSIPEE